MVISNNFLSFYLFIQNFIFLVKKVEKQRDKYKECISQITEMLRVYSKEPQVEDYKSKDHAITEICDTLFSEMLSYIPKKDKKELEQQFDRER